MLYLAAQKRIIEVCQRFDAAWRNEQTPSVEQYLGDLHGEVRKELLLELVKIDLEYRREHEVKLYPETYLAQFSEADVTIIRGIIESNDGSPPQNNATAAEETQTFVPTPDETTSNKKKAKDSSPNKICIPGYDILGEIGRGGMGVVYKAKQHGTNRVVALKMVLTGEHADEQELARFRKEAEAVGRFHHANIVQVYEVGQHNGLPYLSLEYVDGGNLAQKLNEGPPLSDKESAELMAPIARAIHLAHTCDVVHRDLKPANILLTAAGVPKITDFGLAKLRDSQSNVTKEGQILGTPQYMAPEQAGGHTHEIGPATDVYALGVILYELLTGRPPFSAATLMDTLELVCHQEPAYPRTFSPRVDRSLEAICLKCINKAPSDRYESAAALADDLEAFLQGEPVRAEKGKASRLLRAMLRESRYTEVMIRWRRVFMGLAFVYFFLCLGKSLLLWQNVESHEPFMALWVVSFAVTIAVVWLLRMRSLPRLSHVERQLVQIWYLFWVAMFVTALLYGQTGGPVAGLLPILVLEGGIIFGCMATLLGGSFYVMAAACFATAVLEAFFPEVGPLISATVCSPALFWLGWKYNRRTPAG